MADIEQVVNPVFSKVGVPTAIWETIATVESGMNPNAVGDNGTSFGLFQLHEGGQLPSSYNADPTAVFSPLLNAQLASGSIAQAYKSTPGSPDTLAYWTQFAVSSGHPGGSASDPATQAEAQKLYQTYVNGGGTSGGTATLSSSTPSSSGCDWSNPLTYPQCVAGAVNNGITSSINGVVAPLKSGALKVGVFLVALLLLIVGFWIIGNKAGQ